MHIFGRERSVQHDFEAALDKWLGGADLGERAIARNIMHDHRVEETREDRFRQFVSGPCSCRLLSGAIVEYHKTQVRRAKKPDFAIDSLNRKNLLTGRASGQHPTHKDWSLASILDLSLLYKPYTWAKTRKYSQFQTYDGANPDRIEKFLNGKLDEPRKAREFILAVLSLLAEYQHVEAHHPTWVTSWYDFEPYVTAGPERWLQIVGVERPANHWLIVLRYPARDIGTLVRPTQLDAGWHAFHFPSPPHAPLAAGGHPVDLGANAAEARLLTEFIHEQAPHTIEHWEAAGSLCRKTSSNRTADFELVRRRHHSRLVTRYGAQVETWMPTPV